MESVVFYRRKRISRASKFLLAMLGMTIAAVSIAISGNGHQKKAMEKMCQKAFESLGTTVSLQTVQSYAPTLQYGLYKASGKTAYANWEERILHGNLLKKQNILLDVVEELTREAESENIQEASILDHTLMIERAVNENNESAEVGIIHGENYFEQNGTVTDKDARIKNNKKILDKIRQSLSIDYLISQLYIVDSTTSIDKGVFNVEKLLKKDCSIVQGADKPQILIYHTHGGSESFADSDGSKNESVVGMGSELAKVLTEEYGFHVIHDETCYDVIDGRICRDGAYDKALTGVKKTLKKYPSIEVIIDLHRDAAGKNEKRVTTIDGNKTAQIMLFNGLSRKSDGENRTYLNNKNLQGNLSFSLQTKMKAMELYPDMFTRIYLKGYRYNLHLREKSLLIELGTNSNTVAEARNAMKPLAEVLNEVLNE